MKMSIQNFIIIHATNFKLQGCAITNPYLPLEKKIQIPAMKKESNGNQTNQIGFKMCL